MTFVKFNNRPVEKSINRMMDDFFTGYNMPAWKNNIPVNISETNQSYVIDVFVPGINKEDVQVSLDQNLLTISMEKVNEEKQENVKQILEEYSYRAFRRSFTLDEKIDTDKIEAKYVDGILSLTLPKKPEVKPSTKQISIQ
jgi:Molecular chaperone (small heat shock protein)